LTGLRKQQRWARELFLHWDSYLFPQLRGSRFGGGVRSQDQAHRDALDKADAMLIGMEVVTDPED
jgi:heptaprenylglyceryl phosphate synthase